MRLQDINQNQVSFQSFNEAIIIFVTIKTPKKIPRTNNSTKKERKKRNSETSSTKILKEEEKTLSKLYYFGNKAMIP